MTTTDERTYILNRMHDIVGDDDVCHDYTVQQALQAADITAVQLDADITLYDKYADEFRRQYAALLDEMAADVRSRIK